MPINFIPRDVVDTTVPIVYPVWGPTPPPTSPQLIASLGLQDAKILATAVLASVHNTSALAAISVDFASSMEDPRARGIYGSAVVDQSFEGLGLFNAGVPAAVNAIVAGVNVPPELLVDAIISPVIDMVPAYTQNNLGFVWDEALWDLSLLTTVQAKLLSDLANGGYGIEPADEAALWQRDREREHLNGEVAIQEAARQAGARGLMLPPGVFFKQMLAAQQAAVASSNSASRDIALKRADLYVQNRQFTIEKAIETERALVEYVSAYYARKLDAIRANLDAYRISVEIYDAQLKAFTAKLGAQEAGIRMKVEIIDAQVKINVASMSRYEAQLRGEIAKVSLSVDNYKARVQSASLEADTIYKSQTVRIAASEGRLRKLQQDVQNTVDLNKLKLSAIDSAAKLYIEPTQALTSLASAYVGGTSSIALASS